jgi:hypothetical protein
LLATSAVGLAHSEVMLNRQVTQLAADVSVGDTSASATVVVIAVVLMLLSIALAGLAIWLWRATAVDDPSLSVLEEMSSRRYREADAEQKASLRTGATPVIPDDGGNGDEVISSHE